MTTKTLTAAVKAMTVATKRAVKAKPAKRERRTVMFEGKMVHLSPYTSHRTTWIISVGAEYAGSAKITSKGIVPKLYGMGTRETHDIAERFIKTAWPEDLQPRGVKNPRRKTRSRKK